MIQEDLISYETALLAKSKGFDLETLHFYTKPNSKMFGIDEHGRSYSIKNTAKTLYQCGKQTVLNIENVFYAPTQALLAKWLRDVHNIHITVGCSEIQKYNLIVEIAHDGGTTLNSPLWKLYDSYEQAYETGLQAALKLI